MIVTTEEISEQGERLMGMTIVLGELYFSHRMLEDTLHDKDKQIEASQEEVKYWKERFNLLSIYTSVQGMKKFSQAVEELQKAGGQ
jgi:hypothetical protein